MRSPARRGCPSTRMPRDAVGRDGDRSHSDGVRLVLGRFGLPFCQRGVLEVLVLTLSGALLQAGMGVMTYDEMADRLDSAVVVIMRGNT